MTRTSHRILPLTLFGLATLAMSAIPGWAQECTGCPRHDHSAPAAPDSQGGGDGVARPAHQDDHRSDMATIHALMADRAKVVRVVRNRPDGIDTTTRSDDKAVARAIKTHVAAMVRRVEEVRPIHDWDPLFAELFRNADRIVVRVTQLKDGIRVVETSKDPYTVRLLHAHAEVVNGFLRRGMEEAHSAHQLPPKP